MPLAQPAPILFGAAYYPEYHGFDRVDEDIRLMKAAGFTVIRVGESTWATWEPEDGVFDLDWLRPTLDAAQAAGIGVILGTPTYAVPPWLARKYPEIAAERRTGQRIGWGARQEMDYTHAAFRFHAERVIRQVVGHYRDHPAVIGYQVDNEPGLELFHNHAVFQSFRDDLRRRYGTVERLNEAWGLVYWSHRLCDWSDLWTPDNNSVPQYDLAWRGFQARLTTEFIEWQAAIVRQLARPDQAVTTCLAYSRPGVDDAALTRSLDVAAGNLYFGMQDALALPGGRSVAQGWASTGVWNLFLAADRVYSSRQQGFWVTETDAGPIGGSAMNYPGYDGQWRQVAWAMIGRGARAVEYWHWHTLPWGAETYWTGVLPHDGVPGRVYEQIAALGHELHRAGEGIQDLTPDGRLGLLWSNPSGWALSFQAPFPGADAWSDRNPGAYDRIAESFYRGAFEAGVPVRVIHDAQLASADGDLVTPTDFVTECPALLAPGLYVASDALLDWLRRYVAAGGHLVLGPRSAFADTEAVVRPEAKPARLDDLAGATYQEVANLTADVPLTGSSSGFAVPPDGRATVLADGLEARDPGDVLARYVHPHYGRFAAVVSHAAGAGRVTTVGTLPNPALAAALARWAVGDDDPWRGLNEGSTTVTSATVRGGRRLRIVHRWSWEPATIVLPEAAEDALAPGAMLPAGARADLGPWDVRVFLQ